MRRTFDAAIEAALDAAMAADDRVVIIGEDVHLLRRALRVRHGTDRVLPTPISESAFLGAGVGAAMAGLRPVVEVMLVDFVGVAFDALLNHAAKNEFFSGGRWPVPLVVRASCGGGYGDGGQHEQSLWGLFAGVPGLSVVVPSTPADAAGLMLSAIHEPSPVVFLEHKLLSQPWLDYMGGASRPTVSFDVPTEGAAGDVPDPIEPVPLGVGAWRRDGDDLLIVGVGVGAHRALEAAGQLVELGVESAVLDLRSVAPLDRDAVLAGARNCRRVLVVDEDYERGGLSGEIAAVVAEAGVAAQFARVVTRSTIPYSRDLEERTLPNTDRVVDAARKLVGR